jgi:membrane protease YdiL (CAAX protease family)
VEARHIQRRPPYLRFLPGFLFRTDTPKGAYLLKAWLLALVPSFLLSGLVSLLARRAEPPDVPVEGSVSLLLLIVAGPFLETLIMVVPLLGLNRLFGFGAAVVLSALMWAGAHSLAAPIWGLVVWWPFLIFSIALLTWRERGLWTAIAMVTVIHGLQNGTAGALILLAKAGAG